MNPHADNNPDPSTEINWFAECRYLQSSTSKLKIEQQHQDWQFVDLDYFQMLIWHFQESINDETHLIEQDLQHLTKSISC